MLEPGNYRLSRDVLNPTGDRRKYTDWRYLQYWRAGMDIVAEDARSSSDGGTYTKLSVYGHGVQESIYPTDTERYDILVAALVPVPETDHLFFVNTGVNEFFARWLLESGRLDRSMLKQLWTEYKQDDPRILAPRSRLSFSPFMTELTDQTPSPLSV